MAGDGSSRSRRWFAMVEEEEEEELALSGSSSHRSYSDVVRDGSPSPARVASPEVAQVGGGGAAAARPQPVRRLASTVSRPVASRVDGSGPRRGLGGRRGPQPKQQRRRAPLPSFSVPAGMPAGLAGLCFNCAEPGHVAGCCSGPRRCLNCKSEEHVARQCPMSVPPVASAVAVGAPPPPPRAAPPPPPPPQASPPPPRAAPSTAVAAEPAEPALVAPVAPYRLPAHLRLGARGPGAEARPSVKDRLGEAGADVRRSADAGGSQARPVQALEVGEEAETPFSRGLRRERAIRDGPAGLSVVERGESSYARVLRQEQELREVALAAVVGGRPVVDVAAEIGAARPARERCIIYRTREVDEAERALKWGLVAFVSGTRRAVSCSAASAAVLERFPALEGHFSVHRFWPADLLFVFDSRAKRDTLLAADPFDGRDFSLRFGVWNRQLQATRRTMRYRVHLEVVGVPAVAWNLATARMILGSSAWVERLGTEMANMEDMGSFRITAWTDDPASIPKTKEIWVAEPLLFGDEDDDLLLPVEALIPEEVALLGHEATVHLMRVEDPVGGRAAPLPGTIMATAVVATVVTTMAAEVVALAVLETPVGRGHPAEALLARTVTLVLREGRHQCGSGVEARSAGWRWASLPPFDPVHRQATPMTTMRDGSSSMWRTLPQRRTMSRAWCDGP
ncbi:hypothetical protein ACQ4PT_071482 [Festuca glaucescens]